MREKKKAFHSDSQQNSKCDSSDLFENKCMSVDTIFEFKEDPNQGIKKELSEIQMKDCSIDIKTDPLDTSTTKRPLCKICGRIYSHNGDLNRHIASVHERKQRYKCSVCGKGFWAKSSMKRHFLAMHEGKKCQEGCPLGKPNNCIST